MTDISLITQVFSNKARIKILQALENHPLSLSKIAVKAGDISNSEVSRHLSILADNGLVNREIITGRNYRLTSFGKTLLIVFTPLEYLALNKRFFKDHLIDFLPIELIRDIDSLTGSRLVIGTGNVIREIQVIFDSNPGDLNAMIDTNYSFNNQETVVRKLITSLEYYKDPEKPQIIQGNLPSTKWDEIEFKLLNQIPLVVGIFSLEGGKIGLLAFQPKKGRAADFTHCFIVSDSIGLSFLTKIWDHFWELGSYP